MVAYTFTAILGVLWLGTVPLTSALIADVFGTRYLASLFGLIFLVHQVGAFLGVWMGGWMYDLSGSYTSVWWAFIGLGVLATVCHIQIDDKPLSDYSGAR